MIREFRLPDLGEGLTESEIVSWHVAVGDSVTLNQVIAEVETAKAVVELPSPYAGTVARLHEAAGAVVEVGAPIVSFDVGGEAGGPAVGGTAAGGTAGTAGTAQGLLSAGALPVPDESLKRTPNLVGYGAVPEKGGRPARRRWITGAAPAASAPAAAVTAAAVAGQPEAPETRKAAAPSGQESQERPRSTPPVRKLARDLGIDLEQLQGTGPDGLIIRADVTGAAESTAQPGSQVQQPGSHSQPGSQNQQGSRDPQPEPAREYQPMAPSSSGVGTAPSHSAPDAREERIPIAGMRKHTAAAMVASAFTAPHVTVFLTVDVTPSIDLLARLRRQQAFDGLKLTPLTLAAKAVCLALQRHPSLNSRWDDAAREIVQYRYVNLGIAAATPRGLMVPNVKDAAALGLRELAAALGTLAQTARAGKTTPADLAGGTFSISNVGVFGVDAGTPILNPGEAAILALGAVREQPWAYEGAVALRQVMTLSLSFDHRLVDGEQGARFLSEVGMILAEPAMALALV
ncbi:dihydrolipoamide acetyltransferase family protein [Arthrobacter sp. zg-Y1219]|uniref:dihydrolipoamide acetyltransferase family protein n=1 Tax=Arthrobacter sp. zg-Y1219 TaxID=3049067 RepID=UPI0024C412C4|nr:dihydrolipoamide acetyltransferase family protein [Arthrobacter sp. zg-Y1219]MDK1360318.1 dihydrolipoamide acetyltransferase family protein [Arthrobacter sp. zg-Y1219]